MPGGQIQQNPASYPYIYTMERTEQIRAYLTGRLPLEEAQAFERAMKKDPELAMEVEFHDLEERQLDLWEKGELGPELNGWLPGLEALRQSGAPLWLMSLLTSTMVVGMTGARSRKRQKPRSGNPESTLRQDSDRGEAGSGQGHSDEDHPPRESSGVRMNRN